MKHAMVEKSTPDEIAIAEEAADWLIDAVACATQDKRFLRGGEEYDSMVGQAIILNGVVACLRAMHSNKSIDQ